MKSVEGVIILTQEGRFELATDGGRVMQFVLAHDARLEPQDLPPLRQGRHRVRVDYTEPSHLIGYLAHTLSSADGGIEQ
jgi:hypothetical protein